LTRHTGFYQKTAEASAKRDLASKLYVATYRQSDGRQAICPELGDVEHFRQLSADLRDHVLKNLDTYLDRLVANLERAGTKIHWARTAEEAREIVRRVAADNAVKRIVKSKSMITEEIDLNPVLEADGIEVTETDLGEYIVQLAGQKPGHIVTPAVHCSTQDVVEIFQKKIGYNGPADPTKLTKAARVILRDKFRNADMGISGVNFAVADPGLIAICTNEGNGRYVTTRPRIYLAVMGIERIVPDLEAAALMLKMLARFSTGQRITQYTTFTAGPSRDGEGPEQVHLVLVDNGRSGILAGKYWRILRCIRCGSCLNACPVFRHIGGHCFPGCYSGPIGSILLPQLLGLDKSFDLPKASSLCGLCGDVCPVKVPIPDILLDLRHDSARSGYGGPVEKIGMTVMAKAMRRPWMYRFGQRAMRWFLKPMSKNGWIRYLPGPPGGWTSVKDLPVPAPRSFLRQWQANNSDGQTTK